MERSDRFIHLFDYSYKNMKTKVKKIAILALFSFSFFSCGGSFTEMKEAQEEKNAKNYYSAFREANLLSNNPHLIAYVKHHGALIEPYANEKRNIGYQFEVVDWEEMNAINVGAGLTFMFSGMLRWAETTDEVVMIMGHEAAHSADRHMLDAIGDQIAATILQLGLILSSDFSEEDESLINFVDLLTTLRSLHYSRKHEMMADHFGARFVWDAGFNPHYSSVFFNRIQQLRPNGEPSNIDIAFSTHPTDETRISSIENQYKEEVLNSEEKTKNLSATLLGRGFPLEAISIAYTTKRFDGGIFYNNIIKESTREQEVTSLDFKEFKNFVPRYKTCININTANESQLQELRPITPGLAASIIGHRIKNGNFPSVESIQEVKGLKRDVYLKVKNHLSINETCENLPLRPKEDYEIVNEYEAVLWGTAISLTRRLRNYPTGKTSVDEDFLCLLDHLGYFRSKKEFFRELTEENSLKRPEKISEEVLGDLYDCSIPILINLSEKTLVQIKEKYDNAHLSVLGSFFGNEGPVDIDSEISEIWETINDGEWGRESNWILLHLINGDLYRSLFGPLRRYDKEVFSNLGER